MSIHWKKKKPKLKDVMHELNLLLNSVIGSLTHGKFVKVIDSYDRLAENFERHNRMVNDLKGIVNIMRLGRLKDNE